MVCPGESRSPLLTSSSWLVKVVVIYSAWLVEKSLRVYVNV